jgi:hypothetical protein
LGLECKQINTSYRINEVALVKRAGKEEIKN